MKSYLLLIPVLLLTFQCLAQEKSFKRGVSYGSHSAADMNTASAGISWWYNWGNQPDASIRTTYSNYGVDYAPMAWNAAGINGVNTWVSQDNRVKYILGFNEPNFKDQANMTPTQAAAAWPQLQAIADKYGLKLVSPAVNYCGNCVSENGTVYTNPFKWLDDFFAACPTCRVDYIALHWYGGGNSMMSYVNDARKYGKPIWITEFADWESSGVTSEIQKNYLAGTTNFLERDPDVFRYSWFIGRGPGETTYPYLDLYGLSSGTLTALGQLYLDIPVYDSTKVFQLPGRIEAEEYYRQSGILGELTKDVDGFMNIGYTDNGDWLSYKIRVPSTGNYTFTGRYSGTSAGKFDVYADDVKKGSISTTNTSGWQNWASASTTLNLTAGEHILKLLVTTKGFNLNWIQFSDVFTGIAEAEANQAINIYPNPVADKKFRVTMGAIPPSGVAIKLIDLSGKTVYTENITAVQGNSFEIDLGNVTGISKGIYTLSLTTHTGTMNRKIVLF